ncbi:MAG: deoxyguanosinetriphosphate triphosphohydrolase [Alphaproteobacteria bacterium]|nr:deoxyguanosinetriphosphate triphosphohydrolase [Alphaproteobacteria bacterium]
MKEYLQDSGARSAPYASKARETRGRLAPEAPSETRTEFQRDHDRIIHSGAFRKLRNKSQVFIENEGDYFRTRLTHSLEVSQIARSIARALGLNEDLTETIALAHDLGHTCFGHSGEAALAEVMGPYGGFSHNEQTIRILTKLERRYVDFDGLNLTWETLEGIAKHNGPLLPEKDGKPLPSTMAEFNAKFDLELATYAGPEAQVAALSDDVAYNSHDIDDGYRAGFFGFDDLKTLPLFGPILEDTKRRCPEADNERVMHAVVRQVIGTMVTDLLDSTRAAIVTLKPQSAADIRKAKQQTVKFSFAMQGHMKVLNAFLRDRMYEHSKVNRTRTKAEQIVKDLFAFLMDKPNCLPNPWYKALRDHETDEMFKARHIADYIAGMTDRYAVMEHRKLFSTETML